MGRASPPAPPCPEGWEGAFAGCCPALERPSGPPETQRLLPGSPATGLEIQGRVSIFTWSPGPKVGNWNSTVPNRACPPFTLALGMGTTVGSSSLLPSQSRGHREWTGWGPGTVKVCVPRVRVESDNVRMQREVGDTLASAPHPWADPAPLKPFLEVQTLPTDLLGSTHVRGFPHPKLFKGACYRTCWGGVGVALGPAHRSGDWGVQEVQGLDGGWVGAGGPGAALGRRYSILVGPGVGMALSTSAIAVGAAGVHRG